MTRPGPRPPRGRHAAPDDDARPEEAGPGGRHAAADPPGWPDAAPELPGLPERPRRRHAAPDDPPNGVAYHRPSLGNAFTYRRPEPGANGHGPPAAPGTGDPTRGIRLPDGHAASSPSGAASPGHRTDGPGGPAQDRPQPAPEDYTRFGYRRPGADDPGPGYQRPHPGEYRYGRPGSDAGDAGVGYHRPPTSAGGHGRPEPGAAGYGRPESGGGEAGVGYHRPQPSAAGYGRPEPPADQAGVGYRVAGPGAVGYGSGRPEPEAGASAVGYRVAEPGAVGYGSGRPEPEAGASGVGYRAPQPGADGGGFGYHRPEPGTHRYGGPEAAPDPWPKTNGYHLETPAPPAVNGYRLDEPVAPVTGFPYTAPPSTPSAYPVNGHGVDAAEQEAASWPARGNAVRPVGAHRTDLDRPLDAGIAVVPLEDEPTQVLDRPPLRPATEQPGKPPHPPRAVVRRRRARRKALEWPFLIAFAIVSAFLIRQYVVQTFFIPSASMHETLVEGDRVLVNKVGYHLHDVHRGDVVVFRKPPNLNVNEDDLIKRVIGLPGETVEGRDGKVYVNGAPLDEPYVEPLCHGTGEFPKVTVPAGKLWVMGDNRCNSSDSRVFGPIDQHLVVGRAFVLAWPFDRVSWL